MSEYEPMPIICHLCKHDIHQIGSGIMYARKDNRNVICEECFKKLRGTIKESNEDDIRALVSSIIARIREYREEHYAEYLSKEMGFTYDEIKLNILDKELVRAVQDYVNDHPDDKIIFGDD